MGHIGDQLRFQPFIPHCLIHGVVQLLIGITQAAGHGGQRRVEMCRLHIRAVGCGLNHPIQLEQKAQRIAHAKAVKTQAYQAADHTDHRRLSIQKRCKQQHQYNIDQQIAYGAKDHIALKVPRGIGQPPDHTPIEPVQFAQQTPNSQANIIQQRALIQVFLRLAKAHKRQGQLCIQSPGHRAQSAAGR